MDGTVTSDEFSANAVLQLGHTSVKGRGGGPSGFFGATIYVGRLEESLGGGVYVGGSIGPIAM
jgi:hypothetical protein